MIQWLVKTFKGLEVDSVNWCPWTRACQWLGAASRRRRRIATRTYLQIKTFNLKLCFRSPTGNLRRIQMDVNSIMNWLFFTAIPAKRRSLILSYYFYLNFILVTESVSWTRTLQFDDSTLQDNQESLICQYEQKEISILHHYLSLDRTKGCSRIQLFYPRRERS